jgi:hypothetical protein
MASIARATFLQSFSYRPFVSVDARGVEVHGDVVEAKCRYEPSTKLTRDARGQATAERAVLYTETAVGERDLVWPPGVPAPEDPENTTGSFKPLAVHPRYPLFGTAVDHYEVHL